MVPFVFGGASVPSLRPSAATSKRRTGSGNGRGSEAAQIARRVGRRVLAAEALSGFAHAAAAHGDPDRAARLAGAATTLGITTGTVAAPDRVTRPARAATTLSATTGLDPTLIPFASPDPGIRDVRQGVSRGTVLMFA